MKLEIQTWTKKRGQQLQKQCTTSIHEFQLLHQIHRSQPGLNIRLAHLAWEKQTTYYKHILFETVIPLKDDVK